jgi:pimeloyl-ACP methyl ester carboxylesterase
MAGRHAGTGALRQFTRAGLTFDVTDTGPTDGPPVILLHGFPTNRTSWDAVAAILNNAGFRTLAPDQRGYSPEATPPGRLSYRSVELVRDAIALMDAVGADTGHVVGHDWGGFVTWALAAAIPERISGITVLSTPHPAALSYSLRSSAQLLRSSYMGFFQLPGVPEAILGRRLPALLRNTGLPAADAERYGRFLSRPGALRGALNWYRGMALPDRRSRGIHVISLPTTYVWGSRDRFLGRRAAELTRSWVGAPYRFVELDENHWLPERAPDRVAAEILAGLGGSRSADQPDGAAPGGGPTAPAG